MVVYYISYSDEPRRRFRWRVLLAVLAALLAAGMIVAVLGARRGGGEGEAAVRNDSEPVSFVDAVPAVFAPGTNTVYVVDISGSIAESGHLDAVKLGLSMLALEDVVADSGSGAMAENSRAALVTFGGDGEPEILVDRVELRDPAAQVEWLTTVDALEATATGSFIYDAISAAYQDTLARGDGGRENAIVALSDGIDGAVGECRPARGGETTEYCVGASGDPVPCDALPGRRRGGGGDGGGGLRRICEVIHSETDAYELLRQLAGAAEEEGLKVHAIGYGSPDAHRWLRRVAERTGGQYIYAGRQGMPAANPP